MKKNKGYPFRREDSGRVVYLPFEQMMEADSGGFVTLSDGVRARRAWDRESPLKRSVGPSGEMRRADTIDKPLVSDALGFPVQALDDFEEDRKRHGFDTVEFRPDPRVPEFYQAHFRSRREWARYVKHRGYADRNGRRTSKVFLSSDDFKRARKLLARKS